MLSKYLPIKHISRIFSILSARGSCRIVGGTVRDLIMLHGAVCEKTSDKHLYTLQIPEPDNRITKKWDIDIATNITPDVVQKLLKSAKVKCIATGIKYGTVSAIIAGYEYQITTLREDQNCDGRHAEVIYSNDWQKDATRRDFTINALYMDLEGNVHDYFSGIDDIKNKVLRFIGNPSSRIQEDYLRILRYFRFYSRFDFQALKEEDIKACSSLSDNLSHISGERIQQEMKKLLISPFALKALKEMIKQGIFPHVFTESMSVVPSVLSDERYVISLAMILRKNDIDKSTIKNIISRWRLSRVDGLLLYNLCFPVEEVSIKDPMSDHRRLIYYIGKKHYENYVKMRSLEENVKDILILLQHLKDWKLPKVPVTLDDFLPLHAGDREKSVLALKNAIKNLGRE